MKYEKYLTEKAQISKATADAVAIMADYIYNQQKLSGISLEAMKEFNKINSAYNKLATMVFGKNSPWSIKVVGKNVSHKWDDTKAKKLGIEKE